ncbi:uncharacterized protein LOC117072384 [Trachypithecus francoisi]|uniref:uncharacterized protein LOC117072384 n=1 Tax=Trachypithecus francoisi TaxID=54180 RepID=UPI00141B413A|nr:uncharacterized protein LOC117072384 [Trachypithecus francoisi]
MKLSAAPQVWLSLIVKSPCPLRQLPPASPGSPGLRVPAPHPASPRDHARLLVLPRAFVSVSSFPSSFVSGQTQPQKPATLQRPTARDPARREKPNTQLFCQAAEKRLLFRSCSPAEEMRRKGGHTCLEWLKESSEHPRSWGWFSWASAPVLLTGAATDHKRLLSACSVARPDQDVLQVGNTYSIIKKTV